MPILYSLKVEDILCYLPECSPFSLDPALRRRGEEGRREGLGGRGRPAAAAGAAAAAVVAPVGGGETRQRRVRAARQQEQEGALRHRRRGRVQQYFETLLSEGTIYP